jgi:hypothetical protein
MTDLNQPQASVQKVRFQVYLLIAEPVRARLRFGRGSAIVALQTKRPLFLHPTGERSRRSEEDRQLISWLVAACTTDMWLTNRRRILGIFAGPAARHPVICR